MKEDDIIAQVIDEIDASISADFDVRTVGGDQDALPPVVVLDWTSTRMPNENGHHSKGGFVTDGIGNNVGIEHHTYWRMEIDCMIRSYDENRRDEVLHQIQSAFVPYERDARGFNEDTREWEIGTGGPRNNPVLEPDWYESGVVLAFDYVKRAKETGMPSLQSIQYDIEEME